PIVLGIHAQDLGLEPGRHSPVRRLAPPPVHHRTIALPSHPLHQPPDLPIRQPQERRRFDLSEPFLQHLVEHSQPPEIPSTELHHVLFAHPALPLKGGSLPAKRTFLLCQKRTLSFCDHRIGGRDRGGRVERTY